MPHKQEPCTEPGPRKGRSTAVLAVAAQKVADIAVVAAINEQRHQENCRRFLALENGQLRLEKYVVMGLASSLLTLISLLAHFVLGFRV